MGKPSQKTFKTYPLLLKCLYGCWKNVSFISNALDQACQQMHTLGPLGNDPIISSRILYASKYIGYFVILFDCWDFSKIVAKS